MLGIKSIAIVAASVSGADSESEQSEGNNSLKTINPKEMETPDESPGDSSTPELPGEDSGICKESDAADPESSVTNSSQLNGTESTKDEMITDENHNQNTKSLTAPRLDIFDEETDSESESESESEAVLVKRPRARVALLSDDEDEGEEKQGETVSSAQLAKSEDSIENAEPSDSLLKSDLFAANSDSEEETDHKRKKSGRAVILSDDDGEDDEQASSNSHSKGQTLAAGSDSEEGSGSDGETSSKRLAKPKDDLDDEDDRPTQNERAKSKGTRVQKPRKLKKEAIQKIHSESQRIVRESALRLPYHKPKQMTVNDFFSKKPSARPIKPKKGPARLFIEETKPEPVTQKDDLDDLPDPFAAVTEQDQITDNLSPRDNNSDFVSAGPPNPELGSENVATQMAAGSDSSPKDSGIVPDMEVSLGNSQTEDETTLGENTDDQHQNCNNLNLSNDIETLETGDKMNVSDSQLERGMRSSLDTSGREEGEKASLEMTTPSSAAKKQSVAMRLLQASLGKLKNVTPKLSGEGETVIQLDEGEMDSGMKMPAGVENLMKRFVKHSDKKVRRPKKSQEVQLSIVKKETGADGKESLMQENISVLLEPDEQEVNPKLKVPGAKLTHLKDTLQQKMKERREQERKKRQEAYNIDNEDMDGQEEEEAELTSDDDDDDDNDCRAKTGDSEEDDDDYNPDEEIKEKHEFADDEADEDSDDDNEDDDEMETDPLRDGDDNSGKKKVPLRDGDDSGDEISPNRKTKPASKRRIILSDDEDDEAAEPAVHESRKREIKTGTPIKGNKEIHNETSNLSSISSKASSVKKSDSSSVAQYYHDHGKTMDLFDSTSSLTDMKCNDLTTEEKQTSFNLKDRLNSVTKTPDPETASLESSFEMFPSTIPPYQPRRISLDNEDAKDSFTPFAKAKSDLEQNTETKTTNKFPDLSMPVEDTQDLFRPDTPSLQIPDSQMETETQNFKFSFEEDDTQTQFLDGNGFLKLKSSAKRPPPRKIFDSDNATQGNMDELLGLCSGQFNQAEETGSSQVLSSQTSFKKGLFSQGQSQDNMSELLGLCSGNFSSKPEDGESKFTAVTKKDSDNESESSFGLVLDRDRLKKELVTKEESSDDDDDQPIILTRKKKKADPTMAEEDDDELLLAYHSSDDEVQVNKRAFKGVTYSKFAKKKFFEAEAELSGSEADSDEDYDAEDEPDELELDREVEEQFKDTEELREQVNEIYMKNVDDEDARKLRLYKELYLREGDLHSDKTRVRKFRWKHLEGMEMDAGAGEGDNDSDDEEAEQDEQDTQWRLQRHQREQWLLQQEADKKSKPQTLEELQPEENSQFALFMKKVSKSSIKGTSPEPVVNPPVQSTAAKDKKIFNSPKPLKLHKHGSFLKRKRQELEKLASVVKPMNNINGPKSNRGFIFQSVSQAASEPDKTEQTATVTSIKRSMSVPDAESSPAPKSKRAKLDRSVSQRSSQSIFDHF